MSQRDIARLNAEMGSATWITSLPSVARMAHAVEAFEAEQRRLASNMSRLREALRLATDRARIALASVGV